MLLNKTAFALLVSVSLLLGGCGGDTYTYTAIDPSPTPTPVPTPEIGVSSLHSLADFPVGVAVAAGSAASSVLDSSERQAIVESHFNQLSAENIMKPAYIHPEEATYYFDEADALIAYAQAQGMDVHGHTLVWHNQIADWMNSYSGDMSAMMESHIDTIVSHFAGDVVSWDVVNEAFSDSNGALRDTVWLQAIGEGYLAQAFSAARAADAGADLYYNDYNLSQNGSKIDAVVAMVDDFQANSVPIDGVGFQMHVSLNYPSTDAMAAAFGKVVDRGIKVKLTELDVTVNPGAMLTELTDDVAWLQYQRYREIVATYLQAVPEAQRGGITVWGITDADSWLSNFHDRPEFGVLFNADFSSKPALQGFADGLTGNNSQAE